MAPLIDLTGISKSFFTEDIETRAIHEVNLSINKGEYIALTGPSGCGKSTLLSILGLLDTATVGCYRLDGENVRSLTRNQRARIRSKQIGFVFQSFNLISDLNVSENVMLPLTYQHDIDRKTIQDRVTNVLDKVDMLHRKSHFPSQLSGGQQQRIAVARALVNDPSFILADEPTGNLDSKNASSVMALFDQLNGEGSTICMVTHDQKSAQGAHRTIEMTDGCIVTDFNNQKTDKKNNSATREH
jgi:putative ABC transport system ATP-binding protein